MARRPITQQTDTPSSSGYTVPSGVAIAGAWSWRFVALAAAVSIIIFVIIQLSEIVVPVLIALLVTALLLPVAAWLQRHRWPKGLSVAASIVGLFIVVSALVLLVVQQVRASFPSLRTRGAASYDHLQSFLQNTYGVKLGTFDAVLSDAGHWIQGNTQYVTSGLATFGSTASHLVVGLLLALFATIFLLADGRNIWSWIVRLFPTNSRRAINGAGKKGWKTLTSFVRTQVIVAAVDAVGIGLGALLLGLPLVVPIAVAVFLGAFVPVVGAVITGAFAIVIALIFQSPISALIMLGVVLLVQEIESHVLQPFLIGKSVKVHPLAVVLGVAVGSLLAGIPGALFSVPIVAVTNTIVTYIARKKWQDDPASRLEPVTNDEELAAA